MSSFLIQATTTTTTTTLLLLSLFLLSPSTTTADIVLDVKGDPLVASSYYYALPIATQKGGGGLTMFNNGSKTCPSFIVAKSTNKGFGIPIKFDPQTPSENHNVHISSNVNIAFKYLSPQPLCRRFYSTVWAVSSNDGKTVVLDGEEGREDSLFKLEEYGGGYKILFGEKTVLYDEKYSGEVLLSLVSGKPLLVVFVKSSKLDVV